MEAPTIEEDDEEGVKGKAARLAAAKADGPAGRSDKEVRQGCFFRLRVGLGLELLVGQASGWLVGRL